MHLFSFIVTFQEYISENCLDEVLLPSTFRGNSFLQFRQVHSVCYCNLQIKIFNSSHGKPPLLPFFFSFFWNMTDPRVLILSHSLVHRLHSFIVSSPNLTLSLGIARPIILKWHGIGGRTIVWVLAFNLHVVESFQPHLVI